MPPELFAGISVGDFASALRWYERLLGKPPSFFPNDTEAVWELAEHRWIYIEERPDHAGHALTTVMVEDVYGLASQVAERGIEPAEIETYDNGVRKIVYRDPEGNEIGFGGLPIDDPS